MTLLRIWIFASSLSLLISLIVHLSTFFGLDPMQAIPEVMFIHLAIFPPFIAAILYMKKINDSKGQQEKIWKLAPHWMQIMSGAFFAYAIVNFIIFLILVKGGGPEERDGKFVLAEHGRIIQQLTEAEFHRMQAYVVRGFSGHWMLFSAASLTFLTGVYNYRSKLASVTQNR
jgi:hypothetical protein